MLHLWSSFYECGFRSPVINLQLTSSPRRALLTEDDVVLAPLKRNSFMRLFLSALNASVKVYSASVYSGFF